MIDQIVTHSLHANGRVRRCVLFLSLFPIYGRGKCEVDVEILVVPEYSRSVQDDLTSATCD